MNMSKKTKAIWFTGLSGSGKTTLGGLLFQKLKEEGRAVQLFDGDEVRKGLNKDLGFSEEDRKENIRRIAEISKLLLQNEIITINCFITPTQTIRNVARNIIGRENVIEIFLDTPVEECKKRDSKGLYAKAEQGIIKNFTGVDAPFEVPIDADLTIDTMNNSPEEALKRIYDFIRVRMNT